MSGDYSAIKLFKRQGTAVGSMKQPNEEQTFVHFPALGGHTVCMVLWGQARVSVFLLVLNERWWASSLLLGCNHGDRYFRSPQVPPFSVRSHRSRGRVDLLLLPQRLLSSGGKSVTEHPSAGDP